MTSALSSMLGGFGLGITYSNSISSLYVLGIKSSINFYESKPVGINTFVFSVTIGGAAKSNSYIRCKMY